MSPQVRLCEPGISSSMQTGAGMAREGVGTASNGKEKEEGDIAGAAGFCPRHGAGSH